MSEETRTVVFSVKTSVQTKVLPRELNVLDVKLTYDTVIGGDKKHVDEEIKGKLSFVDAADAQKDPTKDVMAIVGIAMTVQAQIKAEEAAKAGNFAVAQNVLLSNASLMDSFNLHDHGGMSRGLSAKYDSHASYSSSSGYRDVLKKGLTRSSGTSDREAVEVLASVGLASSNSAMDQQVQSFTGGGGGSVGASIGGGNDLASLAGSIVNSAVISPPTPAPTPVSKKPGPSKKRSKRW